MANRDRLGIVTATVALVLAVATQPVFARLPWAASSGLHFVDAVVAADNYRAAAAGLAMKRSPSLDVRETGRALWVHSLDNTSRLRWLLNQHDPGVVLPQRVSPQYMFVIDQLVFVHGEDFDRRYIAQQTASLKESLALAQAYARYGDDFDLKEYAARSVPRLQTQLDRILGLQTMRPGPLASR